MIGKIKQRVSAEVKKKRNKPINLEEFKLVTKMLLKNKPPGIDRIPAEF